MKWGLFRKRDGWTNEGSVGPLPPNTTPAHQSPLTPRWLRHIWSSLLLMCHFHFFFVTSVADTRKNQLLLCFEDTISNLKLCLQCTILVVFLLLWIDVCIINSPFILTKCHIGGRRAKGVNRYIQFHREKPVAYVVCKCLMPKTQLKMWPIQLNLLSLFL